MNSYIQLASIAVLLGGSLVFGFLSRPKEMSISVIAGFLGLTFANIDKISHFKAVGFEAEMYHDQLLAVLEKETEPDTKVRESGDKFEAYGLVGEESPRIVKALMRRDYTWRNLGGIVKDADVSSEKARETLDWLTKNGLASSLQINKGAYWTLTKKGREVFANLQ